MILPLTEPLRLAVHLYTPTSDGPIFLSDRTDTSRPFTRLSLGPTHWNDGVPVTLLGRAIEQVRWTVFPAGTESGWEVVTDMFVGSVKQQYSIHMNYTDTVNIQWNLSNLDTNGAEERVRCPHFRG